MLPTLALAGALALSGPQSTLFVLPYLLLVPAIVATLFAHSSLTKPVMVIVPDGPLVAIDEKRLWRDEERKIPDNVKRPYMKGRVAWLYPVYEQVEGPDGEVWEHKPEYGYRAFAPWSEPLESGPTFASASSLAEIRASMEAGERLQRHQLPDSKEIARYGLLALITAGGLLMAYLAMSRALDAFSGQ